MHISEGVLSAPVLAVGACAAIIGLVIGLKKMRPDQIPMTGVMAAVFFVASLIHVPIGVVSAHLLLIGLTGVLLGWLSFPAIFAALVLQALLFQYGGITTLGVNTASMGYGAVCAWGIFRLICRAWPSPTGAKIAGFAAGCLGVAISGLLTAGSLAFTDEGFFAAAAAIFLAHLPVMLAEGVLTALTAGFISYYKPDLLFLPTFSNRRPAQ